MTANIISLIIIIFLLTYNLITYKKNKTIIRHALYNKIKKLKIFLYLLSVFIFVLYLIINLSSYGISPTTKELITSIINALSISILVLPLSLETLYINTFKDEENYSHIKTIITNIYDKALIDKFNKADINIILLSEDKTDLKQIKEDKITSSNLLETFQIKTSNLKLLDKLINKSITKKEFKNLNDLYEKIYYSRGVHDNYIRTIKYLVATYTPIILSYLFLGLLNFPVTYNLLLVSLLKLFTTISSRLIFKYLPFDKDIMTRQVKPSNLIISNQELFLLIIDTFLVFFCISLPYMYVLAKGAGLLFANSIYFSLFSITNIFIVYYYLNDSSFILNILKYIKELRIHLITIIYILFIIFINNNNYFLTRNIAFHNILGCLIISTITLLIMELTKVVRFISMKGSFKHENKNNKKSRRSKPNNS